MNTTLHDAMSHTALGWVKPELDETLVQVGQEIGHFVETPNDIGPLRRCVHYLHQVQGSLRMLELPAPALLVEELERLVRALAQGAVKNRDDACGLMMRCTMLLPNYLERLQDGHREIPVVLLPLLNEVRSARNAPPVNERVLLEMGAHSRDADSAEIEHARNSLGGRNRAVLDTVGTELKNELQRIKDALDLHMRLGQGPTQLQPQVQELDRVADTLAMMEFEAAREVVLKQRHLLQSVVSGARTLDNTVLLDVANALLQVEAVLDDQATSVQAGLRPDEDSVAAEVRRTTEAVAKEAIANFVTAREAIVAFIETNWDHSYLNEIPRLLDEVIGALHILELQQPAAYLTGIGQYVSVELLENRRVPGSRQMDTLADAMASFEYWLEALRDRRPNSQEILDITRSSLESLRYWPLPARVSKAEKAKAAAEKAAAERAAAEKAAAERVAAEKAAAERAAAEKAAAERAAAEKAATERAAAERAAAERAATERAAAERAAAERAAAEKAAAEKAATERAAAERAAAEKAAAEKAAAERVAAERAAAEKAAAERAAAERAAAERAAAERAAAERAAKEPPRSTVQAFKAVANRFAATIHNLSPSAARKPATPSLPSASVADTPRPMTSPAPMADMDADPMFAFMAGLDAMAENLFAPSVATPVRPPPLAAIAAAPPVARSAPDIAVVEPEPSSIPEPPRALETPSNVVPLSAFTEPAFTESIIDPNAWDDADFSDEADFSQELAPVAVPDPEPLPSIAELPVAAQISEPAAVGIEAGFEGMEDGIDQDICDIFLEEFDEQLEELDALLPPWTAQPDNLEKLHSVRRVFHTLKGSGRLVGARVLGEFAWKIEHMLNQVIEGKRPPSAAVAGIVEHAWQTLPQFNTALRENGMIYADIRGMEAIADRVADGEEVFYEASPSVSATLPASNAEESVTSSTTSAASRSTPVEVNWPEPKPITASSGTAVAIDSVLLDILQAEVSQHLLTIEHWLAEFQRGPQPVTPELQRAIHTVNGAFAVSAIPEITGVISAAESMIKRALAAGIVLDETSVAALTEAIEAVNTTMTALHDPNPWIPCFSDLIQRLRQLVDALPRADWAATMETMAQEIEEEAPPAFDVFEEQQDVFESTAVDFPQTQAADIYSPEEEEDWAQPIEPIQQELAPVVAAYVAEDVAEETAAVWPDSSPSATGAEEPLDFNVLDRDLVDIFVEEGKDMLDRCDDLLEKWRESPADHRDVLTAIQRNLHTVKGGARMAGITVIGDLSHSIESLLEAVTTGEIEVTDSDVSLLEHGFDRLHQMLMRTARHVQVQSPIELIHALEGRIPANADTQEPVAPVPPPAASTTPVAASPPPQAETSPSVSNEATADDASSAPTAAPVPPPPLSKAISRDEEEASASKQVKVRADLLDQLVNQAGEVAIYRSRLEQQLTTFSTTLLEMDRTNARLRDQLRRLELETEAQIVARYRREQEQSDRSFDPLELDRFSTVQQLSRALHESAADLSGLQGTLEELARHYENLLQQQSRAAYELQEGLMHTRLVPFDTIASRLRRLLRQTAANTGKQVQLNMQGTSTELDRHVLESMTAPLEHMLRNCVAHGIETPGKRRAAGKAPKGTITVRMHHEGSEIVLVVADDGAGLDPQRIRERAEARGLIQPGQQLAPSQLNNLIMESGLSTSAKVDQLSGRGVGLDVVRNEVRQLGGSVDIQSEPGKGVSFTLRLPQTMAVTQAVFVRIGETRFAVPMTSVIGVGRTTVDRFDSENQSYYYNSEEYPLYDLGVLLGIASVRAEGGLPQIPVLLVRVGELRAAVAVNQVLGNREVVVKQVGQQIFSIPGIHGATITGDGTVMIILDVVPLVRRYQTRPQSFVLAEPIKPDANPLVMVVDDSLTMRKVTARVLERHNFEVVVARDGVEALEKLEDKVPDLMLLDIEMPRMDGYELARVMRADSRYRKVPIIMITSRSGDKHRQRALDLGVQRHLGKPYQELDLMRNIYDLLGGGRGHA